ncbi:MAG: nucleotide-binding universal stress UspA family protein [Haloarculaceae archaeon]|jgi:nucleotide-binding universal stress UspA family protein
MYDSILIPFDGSDEAQEGVDHGLELAGAVDATVHAMYVVDLPGAPRTVYIRDDEEEIREEYHDYGEEVTADVCDQAADAGVDCETVIKTGAIHEEITEYAEEEGIDLIVMGTAYRGKVGAILGGEAEKVVRTSTVPVTTVRMQRDG